MTKVNVIIPSYNGEVTVMDCLNSVLTQDFDDYEVIMIDSSTDKTPKIIQDEFPRVKLYHFDERKNPGEARNIGIKRK